jgi:capsular exopolysaccharide synthesis family protein
MAIDDPKNKQAGNELRAVPAIPTLGSPLRVTAQPVASVPPVGAAETSFDALALVRAFRRRWILALSAGFLCAVLTAAVAWWLIPSSKYISRTTLMITTYMPRIIFETAEARSDFHIYQRTQMALLKSRYILSAVLRDPRVARLLTVRAQDDPVEWLEKAIKVEYPANSEILELSLSGDRPEDLEVLLNMITEKYKELVVEAEQKARIDRHNSLRELWHKYQDRLRDRRNEMRKLVEKAGSDDKGTLVLKQQLALEAISVAQQSLMGLRPQILRAEADVKYLEARAMVGGQPTEAPPSASRVVPARPAEIDDPGVQALRDRVVKLEGQLVAAQRRARSPSDPSVISLRRELMGTQRDLASREAAWLAQLGGRDEAGGAFGANPLAQARQQLEVLKIYEEALKKDVERFQQEARLINLNTLDVEMERDQMALDDAAAKKIGAEVEALDVELRAPPRIKVVDPARAPLTKDEMKKVKMTGMAGIGAFATALIGITFWEFRSRRISSVDEVVRSLRIRLVGALPAPPSRNSLVRVGFRSSSIEEQTRHRLIESIDATRTMLLHASRERSTRIVMVTSALKGEGKTTLSGHLATSLARAGRMTLLIDCDFRRPSIQGLFDVSLEPGLSELLRGEADFVEVIRESTAKGLHVITAGRWDSLALQALALDRARPLFEHLSKDYDFIVVDSAPVLQVADTLLLSQQVDAVIFSILRDVSTVPNVQAAYERLEGLGVRILGAVVNGAQSDVYSYYSGYY